MTLSIPRLLRWARCVYGRRSLRGLVLGSGNNVSSLVSAHSSASVYPTARLLLWRRDRCGRSSHLRSLLLRWHVDEDDDELARTNAGSGSHNLDAPLPGAPKMSWETNTYGAGPLSVRQGAEGARRADRGRACKRFYPASELPEEIILLLLLCGCIMFLHESVGVFSFRMS